MSKNTNHIIFLGTGTSTGVPVLTCNCEVCSSEDAKDKRLRSSAFVSCSGVNIIIDCGPDFRQQMLTNKINDFDAIILTHGHRDHIAGFDDLRAFNYLQGKIVDVYSTRNVVEAIKTEFPYIFDPKGYKGSPRINLKVIDDKPFEVKGLSIYPIPVMHGEKMIVGYRMGDLVYLTDVSSVPETSLPLMKKTSLMVVNALRKQPHTSHFSLQEAISLVEKCKPRQAAFTHISHFLGLYEIINKELPSNMMLAYDNLKLNF